MSNMNPVTILTAQWGDLPFEQVCKIASEMGYDGLEIGCTGDHFDVEKGANDKGYVEQKKETLEKYGLKTWCIATHLMGQLVADVYDKRHDNFVPDKLKGNHEAMRSWAIDMMTMAPHAIKNMGCEVTTSFLGSPIWNYWYSFPQTTPEMIEEGFQKTAELWNPIFDEFDKCGVKYALEVHPSEIAYDIYTTRRTIDAFDGRKTFGINFDPSHLIWQGITPHLMIRTFPERIYHVHMKDAYVSHDEMASVLGSHMEFGDVRRGWNFRSVGRGGVNFEDIIRELNTAGYDGPLSVEWEDSGMDRMQGAKESCDYVKNIRIKPSDVAFDSALKG